MDDQLLSVRGHPAGDAFAHGDPQVSCGLALVFGRVGTERHRIEGAPVRTQDVDAGVIEGHDTMGLGAERSTDRLHARQASELCGYRLDRLELGRPGDGARPQSGRHVPHHLPSLDASQRQVLIVERLPAMALQHQQATAFIRQGQPRDSTRWSRIGPPGGEPSWQPAGRGLVPDSRPLARLARELAITHRGDQLQHTVAAIEVEVRATIGLHREGKPLQG